MRHEMKFSALAAAVLISMTGPAIAGPDWANIERARALKQARMTSGAEVAHAAQEPAVKTKRSLQNYGPRPRFVPVAAAGGKKPLSAARAD